MKAAHFLKVAVLAAPAMLWVQPAHAYLDPTTGSIILQGLIAGAAGVTVVLRLYWGRVKTFFRKWTHKA